MFNWGSRLLAKAVKPGSRFVWRSVAVPAFPFVCYCEANDQQQSEVKAKERVFDDDSSQKLERYCGWSLDAVSSMVTQAYLDLTNAHRIYRDSLKEAIAWINAGDLLASADQVDPISEQVTDRVIESRLAVDAGRKAVRDAELLVEFAKKALEAVGETAFLAQAEGIGIMAGERLISYKNREKDEKTVTSELEGDYVRAQQRGILATSPNRPPADTKPAQVHQGNSHINPAAVHYDDAYFSLADLFFL